MARRSSYDPKAHTYADTEEAARTLFKTFHAREPSRVIHTQFEWPKALKEVGAAKAELYRSNKWKSDLHEFEDYKHIAESYHRLYVVPDLLRYWDEQEVPVPVVGKSHSIESILGSPLPQHFANLAMALAVQVQLRLRGGKKELGEITIPHATLAGGRRVDNGKAFLFLYTQAGVHLIITGDKLDVLADGIVN